MCVYVHACLITLIAGRLPVPGAVDASCLDSRQFNNSSLVSAPVFFDFGEPTAEAIPSLKEEVVLILSTYVEYLREKVDRSVPGNSTLNDDDDDVVVLVSNDVETELRWKADEDSKISDVFVLFDVTLFCRFIKFVLELFIEFLVE